VVGAGGLARNQSQIASHLLAASKPFRSTDDQHEIACLISDDLTRRSDRLQNAARPASVILGYRGVAMGLTEYRPVPSEGLLTRSTENTCRRVTV